MAALDAATSVKTEQNHTEKFFLRAGESLDVGRTESGPRVVERREI